MNSKQIERYLEAFTYCPQTGIIKWNITEFNHVVGEIAGKQTENYPYIRIWLDGHNHLAHRIAFALTYKYLPDMIDHINGIKHDNRIENLRETNANKNQFNSKKRNNTSGVTGVSWNKPTSKWLVTISIQGKLKNLGRFADLESATIARRNAELFYYGEHSKGGAKW